MLDRLLIAQLVAFNANVQIAHWQADTRTNVHRALGDLYDSMQELTDKFVEVLIGKDQDIALPAAQLNLQPAAALKDLLDTGVTLLVHVRAALKPGADDDLLNIVADMNIALYHARYFLKV